MKIKGFLIPNLRTSEQLGSKQKWAEIFFDPVMANAALDRIVNNAYRVVLEGESYRKNFIPKFTEEDDKMKKIN